MWWRRYPRYQKDDGSLEGVAAVIDKDFAAEKLAEEMEADILMILTEVENVAINFGTENQQDLHTLTVTQAQEYIKQGQFAPGSMLPKVEAAVKFTNSKKDRISIITSLYKGSEALSFNAGTVITNQTAEDEKL